MSLLDHLAKIEKQEIKKEQKTLADINVPKDAFDRVAAIHPFDIMQFEWRQGEYVDIRVEPLSYQDHQNIRIQARANTIKAGIEESSSLWDDEYQQELSILILWKALKHPTNKINDEKYEPAFSTPEHIKKLTPVQIEKLLRVYEVVRQKYDISNEVVMIKKNMDAWISAIATAAEEDSKKALSFLSFSDHVELNIILCQVIHYMILQSQSKQSVIGSKSDQKTSVGVKSSLLKEQKNLTEEFKEQARLEALNTIEKTLT
jgi:hypothetical protein